MMRNNQCNDYVSFLNELGLTRELDLEQVADRLRHLIVNEWQGPNMHEYKQFLVGEDPDVFIEAERFRNSGTFATSLGDCMPLAMSNVLRIPILILSTQASTPVLCQDETFTAMQNHSIFRTIMLDQDIMMP